MSVPEHLWRFPTTEAVSQLSSRLGFRPDPLMQDPEVELADPSRINEFLDMYESGPLSPDERFLLMAIILNSFEHTDESLADLTSWASALRLVERDIEIHIFSVLAFTSSDGEEPWRVGPDLAELAGRYQDRFGYALS